MPQHKLISLLIAGRISRRAFTIFSLLATTNCLRAQVPGYTIATVAGGGSVYSLGDGSPATSVEFPYGVPSVAVDASGNLYLADPSNARVRKVSPGGTITTFAGGGSPTSSSLVGDGGPATSAVLGYPAGLAIDLSGNLYIADAGAHRVRKVSVVDGTITTVAGPGSTNGALGDGGPATSATLGSPRGITVDAVGNLYISDDGNNRVRKVSADGTITTVAGGGPNSTNLGDGGPATSASLRYPEAVAVDASGNLYISDNGNNRVRVVSKLGTIATFAGTGAVNYSGDGGPATLASLGGSNYNGPYGLAVDQVGNLLISDFGSGRLRVVTTDGKINTVAGGGSTVGSGLATSSALSPYGVALGAGGRVYVAEIGKINDPPYGDVRVLVPTGTSIFPPPSIAVGGAVSASGWGQFSQLAQGSWVSIYGSYLASDSRSWTGADFSGINAPTSLDGSSVAIGGQPAFISYISPGQINAQVPTTAGTGPQPLVVTTTHGQTASYSVTVNGSEPGLLAPSSFQIGSIQYAVALFPDNVTYVLPSGAIEGVTSRPAKAGDTIILYGIGFGPVVPSVPAGQIVQASNTMAYPLVVKIGGTQATVLYNGLVSAVVGLYQLNLLVPKLSSTGPLRLTFTLDNVAGTQVLYLSTQ